MYNLKNIFMYILTILNNLYLLQTTFFKELRHLEMDNKYVHNCYGKTASGICFPYYQKVTVTGNNKVLDRN